MQAIPDTQGAPAALPRTPGAPAPSATAPPSAEPDKLSETITTFAFSYWPTMVAQSRGFLKARGLEVEIIVTPRIPDSARALAAGSHQIGSFIPDSALLAVAQ